VERVQTYQRSLAEQPCFTAQVVAAARYRVQVVRLATQRVETVDRVARQVQPQREQITVAVAAVDCLAVVQVQTA
jgi:hypothetical protein